MSNKPKDYNYWLGVLSVHHAHDSEAVIALSSEFNRLEREMREARAALKRYEEALRRIAEFTPDMLPSLKLNSCIEVARMALAEASEPPKEPAG